jgi:hypothetical protein
MISDEKFIHVKKLSLNTFPLEIYRADCSTGIVN